MIQCKVEIQKPVKFLSYVELILAIDHKLLLVQNAAYHNYFAANIFTHTCI